MKIYTRRGDTGETDLFGGGRVSKDDRRVEAYGAVDELNAVLGTCAAASDEEDVLELVRRVQATLFELGSYLATPDAKRRETKGSEGPEDGEVAELEARIDAFEAELEPLRSFILPGGAPAAAAFHVARTVCRRAERRAVALARESDAEISAAALRYLNRLSDLLFVLARVENRRAGVADIPWSSRKRERSS